MSILIRNIEMPRSCANCEWSCASRMDLGMSCYCRIAKRNGDMKIAKNGRLDFCPLVDVPDRHGKLIDADELIDYCKHFADVFKDSTFLTDKARRDELMSVIGEIINMPAVIPSDLNE